MFTIILALVALSTPCQMPNDAPTMCYSTVDEGIESGISHVYFF